MKAVFSAILILSVTAVPVFAQQQGLEGFASSKDSISLDKARISALVNQDTNAIALSAHLGKHLKVEGPAVKVFKGGKLRSMPKRLVQLINPFAPSEPKEEFKRSRDLNPTPWASSLGWSPGRSAFSDPVTHEPSMKLISVSPR
jgi:hypothetical protein